MYEKNETSKTRDALENTKDELYQTKGALCKAASEVKERGLQVIAT